MRAEDYISTYSRPLSTWRIGGQDLFTPRSESEPLGGTIRQPHRYECRSVPGAMDIESDNPLGFYPARAVPSSAYIHRAAPVSKTELALMRWLDELHLRHPFAGAQTLRDLLRGEEGHRIGRKRVRRLMRRMGICVLYRRLRTRVPAPGHTSTPTCYAGLRSGEPTRFGLPTSPISRCVAVACTCSR